MDPLATRTAGILLPVSALPSGGPCGDFGTAARRFIDFLHAAGVAWWQVLPLGPTSHARDDSPYSSLSAFALEPAYLAVPGLDAAPITPRASPAAARAEKRDQIAAAADSVERAVSNEFRARHEWVEDWALFTALGAVHGSWPDWPVPLRDRDPTHLARARREHALAIDRAVGVQVVLHEQWADLRAYASARGVRIFGDLPMYVTAESADTWAHRRYFALDPAGQPTFESGVPPDDFSADGQRWESPVYDWTALAAADWDWWTARLQQEQARLDLLRLDHFRGFAGYWAIPAGAKATAGAWWDGPGTALFDRVFREVPASFFVAEDLGTIDDPVVALLDHTGIPGMRVAQFGFDGDTHHHPGHAPARSVLYSGTHDNATLRSWVRSASAEQRARMSEWLGSPTPASPALLQAIWRSAPRLAVAPMADVLDLADEGRINVPGLARGNWGWRVRAHQLDAKVAMNLRDALIAADRCSNIEP